jgi:hypothetical protein
MLRLIRSGSRVWSEKIQHLAALFKGVAIELFLDRWTGMPAQPTCDAGWQDLHGFYIVMGAISQFALNIAMGCNIQQ